MSLGKTQENLKVLFSSGDGCFYEFGPFLLDSAKRLLWRNEELVELEPKVLETLLVLVRGGGEVVEKEALVAQVWEGDAVTDSSLFHNIYILRKILANGLNGKECIRNISKRGYCFTVAVRRHLTEPSRSKPRKETSTTLAPLQTDLVVDPIPEKAEVVRMKTKPRSRLTALLAADQASRQFRWWCGAGVGAVLVVSLMLIAFRSNLAETITGDWNGSYSAAEVRLRLVLHVTGSPGQFQATVDSPDQGGFESPVTGFSQLQDEVTFIMAADGARFAGKVAPGSDTMDGAIFQRGMKMAVQLTRQADSEPEANRKFASPSRSGLPGTWTGILILPPQHLRFQLHVAENKDRIEATMDCPDQAIYGTSLSTFSHQKREVRFTISPYGVSFLGRLEENGSRIRGTLSQHGIDGELQLTRQEKSR